MAALLYIKFPSLSIRFWAFFLNNYKRTSLRLSFLRQAQDKSERPAGAENPAVASTPAEIARPWKEPG
jgi:hypothetical protein